MQRWRRRQPDPVAPLVADPLPVADGAPTIAVAEPRPRRTPAEVANDRIIAEQAEIARGARIAEQMAAAARHEWEAHREPVPAMDYSRFTFNP